MHICGVVWKNPHRGNALTLFTTILTVLRKMEYIAPLVMATVDLHKKRNGQICILRKIHVPQIHAIVIHF